MKIKTDGYHIGNLYDYVSIDENNLLSSHINYIKNYSSDKNNLKYRFDYGGDVHIEHWIKEHSIKSNQIEERDKLVKEYGYHVSQRWWDFLMVNSEPTKFFDNLSVKIANNLYEYNFSLSDLDSISSYALYENGDFTSIHQDGFNKNRLCVILVYLSDNWNEGDGGELVVKTKDGEVKIEPNLGKFVVLDFLENNLLHEVLKVNNDFKRYTYIHFLSFKEQETDTYKKFKQDKKQNDK